MKSTERMIIPTLSRHRTCQMNKPNKIMIRYKNLTLIKWEKKIFYRRIDALTLPLWFIWAQYDCVTMRHATTNKNERFARKFEYELNITFAITNTHNSIWSCGNTYSTISLLFSNKRECECYIQKPR